MARDSTTYERCIKNKEISLQKWTLWTREKLAFGRPKSGSSVLTDLNFAQSCKMFSIGLAKGSMNERGRSVEQRASLPKKKSGQFVTSALRSSNGTSETRLCKVVRFHSQLGHTISFFREDIPSAISTDLMQVGECKSPSEWEASFSNFPAETPQRLSLPVRVETVFMSSDNTELVGRIAVSKIAFHKVVIARYTLDNWKTSSDVIASFNSDARLGSYFSRYDHFNFTIKIADEANLESKALLLAVKYCVNGQEYWDNNNSANFQIIFKQKPNPHKFRDNVQVVLPLQSNLRLKNHKELSTSISSTPESIPPAFENYANATGVHEPDKLKQLVNERLSGSKSQCGLKGQEFSTGLESSTPIVLKRSLQPFSSRYNFDNSLFAVRHAGSTPPAGCRSLDESIILNTDRQSRKNAPYTALPSSTSDPVASINALVPRMAYQVLPSGIEKYLLDSETHNKVLEKYCFVSITCYISFHSC